MPTPNSFLQSPFATLVQQQEEIKPLPGSDPVADAPLPDLSADVEPAKAGMPSPVAAPRRAQSPASLLPPENLRPMFEATASHFGVPVNVLMALAQQESGYDSNATNKESGAEGMAQYIGATSKSLGINARDPNEAIPAAAQQLRERLDKGMSVEDAVREHFAGPDRKKWGEKTAAYGQEVLAKAGAIGKELYGDAEGDAGNPASAPAAGAEQNQFAPDRMSRADYEKEFRALNPRAGDGAVQAAMTQYDTQAAAKTKAAGNRVQDRFAALKSPEAMFDARLNAKLQGKQNGVEPQLPARQQPLNVDTSTQHPADRPGLIDQAKGDFGRGIDNLKALGYGAAGLAADASGNDAKADQLLNEYVNIQNDIAKNNPATIGTYKNIHGLGDAGRYAIEAVAENLPMLIPSLVTGGVGAQAAKVGAQRLVGGMIESQVAKGIAREVAERNAAQFVAKRIMLGSAAGAAPATIGMESGSIMGDIYQDTGKKASGTALAFGIPAGLLDTLEPVMALRKIAGPVVDEVAGGIIKRLGVEAGKQFIVEAGTEGLQTILEEAGKAQASGKNLMTGELLDNVIDSALKGGIGGAGMGVASQGVAEARGALANGQVDPEAQAAEQARTAALSAWQNNGLSPNRPKPAQNGRIEPTMGEAPAAPTGPLSAAMEAAAPPAFQARDDGFTAQIMGDDGQMHTLDTSTGITSPASPLEAALNDAADQHQANPAPAPAMPEEAPQPPALETLSLEDLRSQLKQVATQAQQQPMQRQELMKQRKAIEKEIGARGKQAQVDSKPAEEPLKAGPFEDMKAANKMMLRYAEQTGQPHEVVGKEGSFKVQPIGEKVDAVQEAGKDSSAGSVRVPDAQPGTAVAAGNQGADVAVPVMDAKADSPSLKSQPKEIADVPKRQEVPEEAPVAPSKEAAQPADAGSDTAPASRESAAPAAPDVKAKHEPIHLVRMSNAKDFDWSRDKPNGTYASLAEDPDSFESPFASDYPSGKRHDLTYTPKNPLVVGDLKAKHARFKGLPGGAGETSAGVKALHAYLPADEFTRAMGMSKDQVQAKIAERFPGVDASKAHDAYEALEVWGAQEAKARGHDVIVARDSEVPALSEAVLLGGEQEASEAEVPTPEVAKAAPKEAPAKPKGKPSKPRAKEVEGDGAKLSLGKMPNSAEPITVKDGVVHIGKYAAQDYDTGEDVTVPQDATPQQIKDALVAAGAVARGNRIFGMPKGDDGTRLSVGADHPMADEALQPLNPLVQSLADKGAIVLHEDASTLPGSGAKPDGVQALTTADGTIHVVANALGDNARGIVLHEAFHAGAKALIGSKAWTDLQTRLGALYRQGEKSSGAARAFWDAARERVATAKAKGAVADGMEHEEFGAYAIEEYARAPATVRKWIDDLVGAVKAWALRRFGKQLGQVTPAQLSSLAKLALLDAQVTRSTEAYSVNDKRTIEVDGVRRPIVDSEGNLVAPDFAGQMKFWRDYDGALDDAGRPIVGGVEDGDRYSVSGAPQPLQLTPNESGVLGKLIGNLNEFQGTIQDNMNRVKQIQDKIVEQTGIKDLGIADFYQAHTNMPGRIASRKEDFRDKMLEPMVARLAKAGYTQAQLVELLHAQHAEERNKKIAKINPDYKSGSGMKTERANEILKQYPVAEHKALYDIAAEARAIARAALDLRLAYGRMTKDDYDAITNAYDFYVPLKGGEDKGSAGKGGSGPKLHRAMGHGERDEQILENIARDYEQILIVGERNLAHQALIPLVMQYPDDNVWTLRVPPKGRRVVKENGFYVVYKDGMRLGKFDTQVEAERQSELWAAMQMGHIMNFEVEAATGERVVEYVKPLQDNELMIYVKGSPVRMQMNDEKLALQLRPLPPKKMNILMKGVNKLIRWFSVAYTGYNPYFIPRNAIRDIQTGTVNMTGNHGITIASKAWLKYPQAWAAMFQFATTGEAPQNFNGKMGQYLREYREMGGKTGASYMSDLEQQSKSIQRMFDDAKGAISYATEGKVGRAAMVASRKAIMGLAHTIEVLNQAFENALRLALYASLREAGHKPGFAAQAAKTVTVNFDRKGTATGALGAAYLFLNPAVQGTANMMKTITKGEHKYQAWGLIAAEIGAGVFAALHGMDDDKDRWLGEKWETRTKNFRMRIGENTLTIPVSQEYASFYAAGVAIGEVKRGQSAAGASLNVLSSFLDAYYPMQGAFRPDSDNHGADLLLAHIPTVLKFPAQMAMNRNSFGNKVVPEADNTKNRPDNLKMNRSTKNTLFDKAAQGVAAAGETLGADKYSNDLSKVSPETLKLMWSTYTGGLGRFITDTGSFASMMVEDPSQVERADVPFGTDFYKPDSMQALRTRYFDLSDTAREAIDQFAAAKKMRDGAEMKAIAGDPSKRALLGLSKMMQQVNKVEGAFADMAVDINADKTIGPADKRIQLKALEDKQEAIYRKAIGAFKR